MSARWVLWCVVGWCAGGCVTVGEQHHGNPIRWSAAKSVESGTTTLAEALALLGAPDQMQRHPDGLMLLWRHRVYDYARLGIEPGRLVSFIPASRLVATLLGNLSLVVEDGVEDEDRLALLIGPDDVVAGVGRSRAIFP